jgi:hypothetical protein
LIQVKVRAAELCKQEMPASKEGSHGRADILTAAFGNMALNDFGNA